MVALAHSGQYRSHPHSSFPRTYPNQNDGSNYHHAANNTSSWAQFLDRLVSSPPETTHPPSPDRQKQKPNYPRTIEFESSQDEEDKPFDEGDYSLLGLNRNPRRRHHHHMQMHMQSESFGFDPPTEDEDFDRIYNECDNVNDEEQTQTTFMGLNPYHENAAAGELDNAILANRQQSYQQHQQQQQKQNRGDIFRSPSPKQQRQQQQQQPLKSVLKNSQRGDASILSPATAMERRRSQKQPLSSSGITRSRSHSRSHRSGNISRSNSRDIRRTSSRSSRSMSRGRQSSSAAENYNSSVFRGAALIREQLIRSMASADHAMDEANKEFSNDIGWGREKNVAKMDVEDIDFDYSDKHRSSEQEQPRPITPTLRGRIGCGVANSVRFADNEAIEEESQRLDNLARIFMSSSSISTSKSGEKSSKSASPSVDDNSRAGVTVAKTEDGWQQQELQMMGTRVVSPVENASRHTSAVPSNQYAGQYFQQEETQGSSNVLNAVKVVPAIAPSNLERDKFQSVAKVKDEKEDEAVSHARRAGPVWRALVGNHVRFPSVWDTILGSTRPPIASSQQWSRWYYVARHRVKGDKRLNSREAGVRSRKSGGRILMRLAVKEMHSEYVSREIVIGCFHPNSRGIRRGDPMPENENVREVYMAVRWVMNETDDEPRLDLREEKIDHEGVIDKFIMQRQPHLDSSAMGSALGHRKAVNNENVKAVFGDQPPSTSIELYLDELADILRNNGLENAAVLPALVLLKLFLFTR